MTDRDQMLGEFRQGIGGIDPVLDQAANYGKGVRAVQQVMHEQGQVMSSALANNHQLYHTNKSLVSRCRELDGENQRLRKQSAQLQEKNDRQAEYIKQLEAGGGDKFRPLYEQARQTLANYLHDALTSDELRQKLGDLEAQRKELEATPETLTHAQIYQRNKDVPDDEAEA